MAKRHMAKRHIATTTDLQSYGSICDICNKQFLPKVKNKSIGTLIKPE